jgi:hypothetical protein
MNFTFTWILDKFGFRPKVETFDFPINSEVKKPVKKTVVKKKPFVKKVVRKAVRKKV